MATTDCVPPRGGWYATLGPLRQRSVTPILVRHLKAATMYKTAIVLLLLCTAPLISQSQEKQYKENSEAWPLTSSWIKEIPADQQIIAAAITLGALNRKTTSLLESRQDREQVVWVAKITACGYSMLSSVVTKNPSFQSYLVRHSELYARLIRGEVNSVEFSRTDEFLNTEGQKVLSNAFDPKALNATTTQYKDRITATERSLVVYSMLCAKQ